MNEYEKRHLDASPDVSNYLANPLNAFLITKRLTGDFEDIKYVMESGVGIREFFVYQQFIAHNSQ